MRDVPVTAVAAAHIARMLRLIGSIITEFDTFPTYGNSPILLAQNLVWFAICARPEPITLKRQGAKI